MERVCAHMSAILSGDGVLVTVEGVEERGVIGVQRNWANPGCVHMNTSGLHEERSSGEMLQNGGSILQLQYLTMHEHYNTVGSKEWSFKRKAHTSMQIEYVIQ